MFDQLRIFMRHEQSTELVTLGQRGVGAIYTGSAPTPFEIKNDQNELLGVVRESGIYIGQNGNVGTVQQAEGVAHCLEQLEQLLVGAAGPELERFSGRSRERVGECHRFWVGRRVHRRRLGGIYSESPPKAPP